MTTIRLPVVDAPNPESDAIVRRTPGLFSGNDDECLACGRCGAVVARDVSTRTLYRRTRSKSERLLLVCVCGAYNVLHVRCLPPLRLAMTPKSAAMPWSTPPSGRGADMCAWCGRSIHGPATPCSLADLQALGDMITRPGAGDRCEYEARTRGIIPSRAADAARILRKKNGHRW